MPRPTNRSQHSTNRVSDNPGAIHYVQDAQGNVSGLLHSNGAVVESYEYSPQGELLSSTGGVTNPYRFKGREWDAEAGLYFMRARYYDPKVGRFVSEDPIGLAGGGNLYAFAMGDPVNHRDPSGLCPFGDNGAQLTILMDDCPPGDPRTEVFKLISRNGMGRSIIAAIVALQIMVSFYEVRTECPATSAGCTIGKRVLIEATERIGVVDRQGNVVHEVGHVFMNMSGYPLLSQKVFSRGEMFAYALGWNYLLTLTPEERSQSRFADYLMPYSTNPRAALGSFCWRVWLSNTDIPGASC